jgi:hypothetical protein
MKVNVTKSRVMCSRFIHMEHKRTLKAISSISFVSDLVPILDFLLSMGEFAKRYRIIFLKNLKSCLASWKGAILNKGVGLPEHLRG